MFPRVWRIIIDDDDVSPYQRLNQIWYDDDMDDSSVSKRDCRILHIYRNLGGKWYKFEKLTY